eukprot:scaffold33372_cov40-Tisochrysis_lutea.AAC.1
MMYAAAALFSRGAAAVYVDVLPWRQAAAVDLPPRSRVISTCSPARPSGREAHVVSPSLWIVRLASLQIKLGPLFSQDKLTS